MPYYTVKTEETLYHAYKVIARSQADARAKVEFALKDAYVPEGVKHFYTGGTILGEHVIDVITLDSRKV
jgi:hypothetical protein